MRTIALIAMSAKPWHAGHAGLVSIASRECDIVHLFVSLGHRARAGEAIVSGDDMSTLWREVIEPSLQSNVEVTYDGSPVGNIWKELGTANEGTGNDEFIIYADPVDMAQTFPQELLVKYCGNLVHTWRVTQRAVERSETVDVSGTAMRSYLANGNREGFIAGLPDGIDKDRVWNMLYATAISPPKGIKRTAGSTRKRSPITPKSEGLLRSYVRTVISRG